MALAAFFDTFPGTSLDSRWTQVVSGTGSITVAGSAVTLARPSSSDVAYIYLNEILPTNQDWIITFLVQHSTNGSGNGFAWIMGESGGITTGSLSTQEAKTAFRFQTGNISGRKQIYNKWDNSSVKYWWDLSGLNWSAASAASGGAMGTDEYCRIYLQNDGANARWRVLGAFPDIPFTDANLGEKIATISDWTNWSATQVSSNLYFVLGWPANELSAGNVVVGDARVWTGSPVWVLCNGSPGPAGNNYRILRQRGCGLHSDGLAFLPEDRTSICIDVGTGGDWDDVQTKDKDAALSPNGNYYAVYHANDGTNPAQLGLVSFGSSPANAATKWAAGNPIISGGATPKPTGTPTGAWQTPYWGWDPDDAEWKLLATRFSAGAGPGGIDLWQIHLFTNPDQDPQSNNWVYEGLVIDQASGTYRHGVSNPILLKIAGVWHVIFSCLDNGTPAEYSQGHASGTNLLSLTIDGSNPYYDTHPTAQEITNDPINNSRIVQMADTSDFSVEDWVMISDGGGTMLRARVFSVDSGTQITMETPLTIGSGAWIGILGKHGRPRYANQIMEEAGVYYWYSTTFGPFMGSGPSGGTGLQEDAAVYSQSSFLGALTNVRKMTEPNLGHSFNLNMVQSTENISFFKAPFPAGGVSVTPSTAAARALGVSPTVVLGSIVSTPGAALARALGIGPTVVLGSITFAPVASVARALGVNPLVVLGALSVTPTNAATRALGVDPGVVLGSIVYAPATAIARALGINPTVLAGGGVLVEPAVALARALGVDPSVILGAVTATPSVAAARALGVDPSAVLGSTVATPVAAIARALGIDPSVILGALSITPAGAIASAAGIDPTVLITGGGLFVTPSAALARALGISPTIQLGSVAAIPLAAVARALAVNPTVLDSGWVICDPSVVTSWANCISDPTTNWTVT